MGMVKRQGTVTGMRQCVMSIGHCSKDRFNDLRSVHLAEVVLLGHGSVLFLNRAGGAHKDVSFDRSVE